MHLQQASVADYFNQDNSYQSTNYAQFLGVSGRVQTLCYDNFDANVLMLLKQTGDHLCLMFICLHIQIFAQEMKQCFRRRQQMTMPL